MSWEFYSYFGYGVDATPLQSATKDGILNLSLLGSDNAKQIVADCIAEGGENYTANDLIGDLECYDFGVDGYQEGIGALFCDVVFEQEHIRLTNAMAEDCHCIILEPFFPWCKCTDAEKTITESKLNDIFAKYMDILQIPKEKQNNPSYQNYGGYC